MKRESLTVGRLLVSNIRNRRGVNFRKCRINQSEGAIVIRMGRKKATFSANFMDPEE